MTNSTIDITDTKFKAWLAEAAYGNFSDAMRETTTQSRKDAMKKALQNKYNRGQTPFYGERRSDWQVILSKKVLFF